MSESLVSTHYDADYFSYQERIGEFGAWANQTKFRKFIKPADTVLDFGCGGGYLLRDLRAARKVGIEPNASAYAVARSYLDEVYKSAAEAENDSVDVIISDNALEHTLYPLTELKTLLTKLRPGGKIVLVVPCENISNAYHPNDINHHLFSWSPLCLGNLLTEAGFRVLESKPYIHKWPPLYRYVAAIGAASVSRSPVASGADWRAIGFRCAPLPSGRSDRVSADMTARSLCRSAGWQSRAAPKNPACPNWTAAPES